MQKQREKWQQKLVDLTVTGPNAGHERYLNLKAIHQLKELEEKATLGYHEILEESEVEILKIIAEWTECSSDFAIKDGSGYISPAKTLAGLEKMAQAIKKLGERKANIVVATGHSGGMTGYYIKLIPLLEKYGCNVLGGLGAGSVAEQYPCPYCGTHMIDVVLDYVSQVAVLTDGEIIRHTHSPRPMEIILEEAKKQGIVVDAVIADHGFAGYAAKQDILTIAVMDTNDPGLALAYKKGAPLILIPFDDNRPNYLASQAIDVLSEIIEYI